jgi:hypothetical protein
MRNRLIRLAILAAMVVSMSGTALAQICPTGYYFQGGMCYLAPAPGGVGGGAQAAPVHGQTAYAPYSDDGSLRVRGSEGGGGGGGGSGGGM